MLAGNLLTQYATQSQILVIVRKHFKIVRQQLAILRVVQRVIAVCTEGGRVLAAHAITVADAAGIKNDSW